MSEGLYKVVDAINAIGAAAGNVAAGIVSDAAAIASAGGLSGGASASGGMGATSGAGGSSNTTGGLTTTMVPTWGATTVLTPEQAIAALRLLQNRINPLWGQMGGR
jgi:hypothetical protein